MGARIRNLLRELQALTPGEQAGIPDQLVSRRRRARGIALGGASAIAARGLSALVTVVSIPLILDSLGASAYGLWIALASAAAMLSFADGGIDDALTTLIASAEARRDRTEIRALFSTSVAVTGAASLALAALFILVFPLVDWGGLFNSRGDLGDQVGPAVAVAAALFFVALPLGIVTSTRAAYLESYVSSWWVAAGSLLSLLGIVAASRLKLSLPWFVVLAGAGPVLAVGGDGIRLIRRPWLRPTRSAASWAAARTLLSQGRFFLVLQLSAAIAYTSDALIVTRILGPQSVPDYSVPLKLFTIFSTPALLLLTPLWPAVGDAAARRDVAWVQKAARRSMMRSVLVLMPLVGAIVLAGPWLLKLWVGPSIRSDRFLLAGMAIWTVMLVIGHAASMILNGLGELRVQAVAAVAMAVLNLILSVLLTHRWGVAGPVYGSIVSYLVCVLLPYSVFIPRILRAMGTSELPDTPPPCVRR